MPHLHNWIEIGRRPYMDGKTPMIMVMYRCSICGKQKFEKERA